MKAVKTWLMFVLLAGMLAAGGCEENRGAGQPAGNSSTPGLLAAFRNGPSPSSTPAFSLHPTSGEPSPEAINTPSAQRLLTEEEAIAAVKLLHGHNGEVKMSAELQRDADYEGGKRDIWRVEALFPAGNRWWYSLDAADGKLLVLTELEAPSAETVMSAFKPYLKETVNGLRLDWDKTLYPDVTIMQTLESPNANKLAVHLVRRLAYVKEREQFLMDAVIVDPMGGGLRTVPLADMQTNDGMDSYTANSFVLGHGFDRDERLILTMPMKREGKTQYDLQSLDIRTGIISLLVPNVIPDPNPDWLAKGWLSSEGDTLYMNLYESGELWEAKLDTGDVRKLAGSFANQWPNFSLFPSPDGERFIYWGKKGDLGLYTAEGKQLAKLSGNEGYHSRPPVAWSPDGRSFTMETTPDQNEAYIISKGENGFYTFAPKSVLVFDRDGQQMAEIQAESFKPGVHIEFTGWLADNSAAVLHAYTLERQGDVPERVQSAYYLMDSRNPDSRIPLVKVNRIEDMERPEAIISKTDGRLVFVDRKSRCYLAQGEEFNDTGKQAEHLILVSAPGQEPIRWTTSDQGESLILYSYYPATHKTTQTRLRGYGPNPMSIGTDIVFDYEEGYIYPK